MITRRSFVAGSLGLTTVPFLNFLGKARDSFDYEISVENAKALLLEDSASETTVWSYDGSVPGPMLRAKRGQPVTIKVFNRLEQPTTIHWHGLRIDNAMDGVSGLTQDPIPPGGEFVYRFAPPDAGTYWYHPHHRSWEQLARGLYGTLIVDGDIEAGQVDRDYTICADDWRLEDNGKFHESSLGHLMDWSHAGRLGNILTLNGKAYERLAVAPGDRVRLRLINTANARIMSFGIKGQSAWIVALDGQPVPPQRAPETGAVIAPSQRVDLLVDIKAQTGDEIAIVESSGDSDLVAGYLVCEAGPGERPPRPDAPQALRANSVPRPDLTNAARSELVMTGGAMRFLQSASYKGEVLDGRTLATKHAQTWAFNGVAGMTDKPLFTAKLGETIRLQLKNETLWPHAIHLHGHHFQIVSRRAAGASQSAAPTGAEASAMRDTVLVDREETVEIALLADNPGKWMLHCHMLEHQASGMSTWFLVA